MRKDEKGYIVVETLIAFTLYLLAILSILSLVNISVVQSRVHYAITEACESISMYSYVFQATGQAKHITGLSGKAATAEANAGEVVSNLNKIIDSGRNMDGVVLGQGISGAYEESKAKRYFSLAGSKFARRSICPVHERAVSPLSGQLWYRWLRKAEWRSISKR